MGKEEELVRLSKAKKERKLLNATVPLPSPGDVLYAHPNANGEMKSCDNCWFWQPDNGCAIVEGELLAKDVCGYHVEGTPAAMSQGPHRKVAQELAGVVNNPTSCDTCTYFNPSLSLCRAVQVAGKPAPVEANGCCTRWTGKV